MLVTKSFYQSCRSTYPRSSKRSSELLFASRSGSKGQINHENPKKNEQTLSIEINVQSAGVSEEDQIFYTTDDDETEEQHRARKAKIRRNPANSEPTKTIQTVSRNQTLQQLKSKPD